jgi:hypothetical protein
MPNSLLATNRAIRRGLKRAYNQHRQAAERLMAKTRECFPVGALVRVTLGKSRVEGRVVGHSWCWWYKPDEVRIRNVRTGKHRHFSATCEGHDAELLSLS